MCIEREIDIEQMSTLEYRHELKRAIETSHNRLKQAVENLTKNESNKPINAVDLMSFPVNVWVNMAEGIDVKRGNKRFDLINMQARMKAGSSFTKHFHNDVIESTEVISGEMYDITTGKTYHEGDVAYWKNGEIHEPIATRDTHCHVLFKNI